MKNQFTASCAAVLLYVLGSFVTAQNTELECTVKGRMGVYLVLEPAQFDTTLIPLRGHNAMLHVWVEEGLPDGKSPAYFDVCEIMYIEPLVDLKRLRFKMLGEVEAARLRHGIGELYLRMGMKIKITW